MKKSVIGVVAVVVVVLGGLFFLSNGNNYTKEYVIEHDKVQQVLVEADSWTTVVKESDEIDIHVEVSGKQKAKDKIPVSVVQDGGVLKIIQEKEIRDFISNFSFGKENKVTIYLPKGMIGNLGITSDSGDVYLNSVMFNEINVASKSGEIRANSMPSDSNMSLETKSGDIKVGYEDSVSNLKITAVSLEEEVQMKLHNMVEEKKTEGEYRGIVGEGDNQLNIKSTSGYIYIN